MWEWSESLNGSDQAGIRGDSWDHRLGSLHSSDRTWTTLTDEDDRVGFRVAAASVPEPSTFLLGSIGLAGIAAHIWRRRKNTVSR